MSNNVEIKMDTLVTVGSTPKSIDGRSVMLPYEHGGCVIASSVKKTLAKELGIESIVSDTYHNLIVTPDDVVRLFAENEDDELHAVTYVGTTHIIVQWM